MVKEKYVNYRPYSAGYYAAKHFSKVQCLFVEHLTNSLMIHGYSNGRKLLTMDLGKHAFEIIHLFPGENACRSW